MFCSHVYRGCQWSGELCKLDSHLMECEYVPMVCPNGCGHINSLFRLSLEHHVDKECPLANTSFFDVPFVTRESCERTWLQTRKCLQKNTSPL